MQTFIGSYQGTFRAVVPQQFLEAMRKDAQATDAPPFLKQAHEQHREDDDGFIAAILRNGIRKTLKVELAHLLEDSGLGGNVAPLTMEVLPIQPKLYADEDTETVFNGSDKVPEPGLVPLIEI